MGRTRLAEAIAELRARGLVQIVESGSRRDRGSTLYEVASPVDGICVVFKPSPESLRSAARTSKPRLRSAGRTQKGQGDRKGQKAKEEDDQPTVTTTAATATATATAVVIADRNPDPSIEQSTPSAAVPDACGPGPDLAPSPKQLRFIGDVSAELGEPAPTPATRQEAIQIVADLRRRRDGQRARENSAARETGRLEGKIQGRRSQGENAGATFLDRVRERVGYASAAKCDACRTIQYPEPGGRCPSCGESMRGDPGA